MSDAEAARTSEVEIRVVVRDVITALAPEESPLLDGLAVLDDATVMRQLTRRTRGEPLGFGLGETAALATPVIWIAMDQAARRFGETVTDGATRVIAKLLRRNLDRRTAATVMPPLSREQLGEVRRLVLETAARHRLSEARASAIADAVVARLALHESEQAGRQPAAPPGQGPASSPETQER